MADAAWSLHRRLLGNKEVARLLRIPPPRVAHLLIRARRDRGVAPGGRHDHSLGALSLTRMEAVALRTMLDARDFTVGHDGLTQALWGRPCGRTEFASLRVLMTALRAKLCRNGCATVVREPRAYRLAAGPTPAAAADPRFLNLNPSTPEIPDADR